MQAFSKRFRKTSKNYFIVSVVRKNLKLSFVFSTDFMPKRGGPTFRG